MEDKADNLLNTFNLTHSQLKSFNIIFKTFDDYFGGKKNFIYEPEKFNKRIQIPDKPVENFLRDSHTLAQTSMYRHVCVQTFL